MIKHYYTFKIRHLVCLNQNALEIEDNVKYGFY